ncbi:methyl-CpG-binding domain-containing protein 9-like isoform X2 [Euphorbia lathyris]|uniref:methyl-CpG-binding domain-containing protein 9-like isoform X2 n=1 Tax=Euphorbia lathyris TaxID=212925 RepID=UPI003313F1B9
MEFNDSNSNANSVTTRKVPFDIDLNEAPLSSPREAVLPVAENDAAPAAPAPEGSGAGKDKGKGKAVVFDMNALPSEAEGEESEDLLNSGIHSMRGASFNGNSKNVPGNQFDLSGAPSNVVTMIKSIPVDTVQHRSDFLRNVNYASDNSVNTISFQNESEKCLDKLRQFVLDNHGRLADGWRVEFFYCQIRCKTCALYCSPAGNKFESMFDVARYLGLVSNCHSFGSQDRCNRFSLEQNWSQLYRTKKESSVFSRIEDLNQCQENPQSSFPGRINVTGAEAASEATSIYDSSHYKDGFPVQFGDFFVLSLGKVDPRPTYHCASQIWPVGYKSSWHDKVTGSLFVCDVSDGGDCGPVFKVQRYPCTARSIPTGSTILSRPSISTKSRKTESALDINNYEDTNIQMIFSDDSPPRLDLNVSTGGTALGGVSNFQPKDGLQKPSPFVSKNLGRPGLDSKRIGDDIGEFFVEGISSSLVWRMVSEKLVHFFREMYKQNGVCKFCCRHAYQWCSSCIIYDDVMESTDLLTKFCHMSVPFDISHRIESNDELSSTCEALVKWLGQDRFGLDIDFVQELIERLPGVHSFSDYTVLSNRTDKSLQTVGNGFLLVERKNDAQAEKETNCKAPKKKLLKGLSPPGKPLGSKLPAALVGDVVQSWELLWRFSEVLGLEQTISFEELEDELIDSDSLNIRTKQEASEMETTEEGTIMKQASINSGCTGETLYKAHCSLLKVLLGELQSKLTVSPDPILESGESKSKKKKKNLTFSGKPMLDLLPVNQLTWPELARRYLLIISSMDSNFDSPEIASRRESCKVFHCLQGDSGALYGPLPGVALMEADALLLAEAMKQIFGMSKSMYDNLNVELNVSVAISSSKEVQVNDAEIPEWAKVLEPVRKLPTNVGARIRRRVYEALALDPPEWATKILEHSISKEVYKGNASGPTKKAILSVLADVCGETQQPKPIKKRKSKQVSTLSDVVMKHCQKVLRSAAANDKKKVFCNLLGRTLSNTCDSEDKLLGRTLLSTCDSDDQGLLGFPAMVSRPLDFKTIDLRLTFGTYQGSHEAFLEDVREVWNHIRTAYADQPNLVDLADTLSQKFETLYENEVITLVQKLKEYTSVECLSAEAKKEMEDLLEHASEIPKAPWEERVCKVCGVDKDDSKVLLCDKCDSGYHMYCLNPPLETIPEGNWYCPSCSTKHCTTLPASQISHYGGQYRERRHRGEFTHGILESLARLITTMEVKDYWEYSVEERIFLFKFLGDELLNSSSIHENLDQCASASSDLQQKHRSLSTEWKNLKIREEVAEEMAKDDLWFRRTNGLNEPFWFYPKKGAEQHSTSNGSLFVKAPDSGCSRNQPDVIDLESNNQESIVIKNKISVLQDSIACLELQLQKVSRRKDCLGKDSSGRLYWIFPRLGSSPLVLVDGAMTNIIEDHRQFLSNNPILKSSLTDDAFSPNVSELANSIPVSSQIYLHQSNAEIEDLIKWLRDNDPVQKELIESLLHWLIYGRNSSNGSSSNLQETNQPTSVTINVEKNAKSNAVKTRALMALEKKYGPCLEPEVSTISVKWMNAEVTFGERMCRCKCLEPIWTSRHHCRSCHWSFSTKHEIDEHKDGKCSSDAHIDDVSKGKGVMRMEQGACSEKMRTCKSDNAGQEIKCGLAGVSKDMTSPYNFGEVNVKFVTRSSNKELVKEIGLLGSNGVPSLIPSASPYLDDPTLKLMTPQKGEVVSQTDHSVTGDNWSQRAAQKNIVTCKTYVNRSNSKKTCTAFEIFKELEEIGRSSDQSWSKFSFSRPGNDVSIVRDFSLRPLTGKGAQILRQLKIGLLDMDAALPEEAIKSSRADSEKRCTWRAFVKSAKSVFEMVQATIVFENMIKTDFLRKEWWYWSSISAAAKIATISSLALRIYTLDAAIIYETPLLLSPKGAAEAGINSDECSSGKETKDSVSVCKGSDLESI